MSAGDEQGDGRGGQPVDVFGHEVDGDVGGQMVDPVQRSVEGGGESFGRSHSDHERSGQTGTGGHGDGIDIGQLHLGGLTGRGDGRADGLHMSAGGDLGHDSAEAHVLVHRRGHRVRQQSAAAHDPHSGLIAGGFDAEDERFAHDPSPEVSSSRSE